MQGSAEDQVEREWVEPQVRFPVMNRKPQLIECVLPLRGFPVVVGQGNIMTRLSHPVDKLHSRACANRLGYALR